MMSALGDQSINKAIDTSMSVRMGQPPAQSDMSANARAEKSDQINKGIMAA